MHNIQSRFVSFGVFLWNFYSSLGLTLRIRQSVSQAPLKVLVTWQSIPLLKSVADQSTEKAGPQLKVDVLLDTGLLPVNSLLITDPYDLPQTMLIPRSMVRCSLPWWCVHCAVAWGSNHTVAASCTLINRDLFWHSQWGCCCMLMVLGASVKVLQWLIKASETVNILLIMKI